MAYEYEKITVHGRFQTPMHINHWAYVKSAFDMAEHVVFLITNPYRNETSVKEAKHRSDVANNPFTYDQRVVMIASLLMNKGIDRGRYSFKPFDITNEASFAELDRLVPNLVNSYSEWSLKKAEVFKRYGLEVVQTFAPKTSPVSGTKLRKLISEHASKNELVAAGMVPEAFDGLVEIMQ